MGHDAARHGRTAAGSWLALALLCLLPCGFARAVDAGLPPGPSLVGLDHLPTAVSDLDAAAEDYRRLGFALKPGRPHDNGLRNRHVKFPDGSGIELITPGAGARDALTARYAAHLEAGEGPAYLALHARETEPFVAALDAAGIGHARDGGVISLDDPALGFLFFVRDNRSPTDLPEHFAHPNTAAAMTGVWLALDADTHARLARLLLALGARRGEATIPLETSVAADVFHVQNGRIAIVPAQYRQVPGRPVLGAEFRLRDPARASSTLDAFRTATGAASYLVPPRAAHGAWLSFPP